MPTATELSEIVALRIEGKKQHAKRSIFSACMLLIGNHILPSSGKMMRILVRGHTVLHYRIVNGEPLCAKGGKTIFQLPELNLNAMNKESKMARSMALLRQRRRRLKDGRCRYALKASEIPDDLLETWIVEGELPLDETGEADLNDERSVAYLLFLYAYESYYDEKESSQMDHRKAFGVFCNEQAILRTVYWARMSEYPLPEMEIFDFDRYDTILLRLLRALPEGMHDDTSFS